MNSRKIIGLIVVLAVATVGFFVGRFSVSNSSGVVDSSDQVYAIFKGSTIRARDVEAKIQSDLEVLERKKYEVKKRAVEALIREKEGLTPQVSLDTYTIDWRIPLSYLGRPTKLSEGFLPELLNKKGSVEVIIFGNYACTNCSLIPKLVDNLKNKDVRVYFRYSMPLVDTSMNFVAAQAAGCAKDQGKFFEFHDGLFKNHVSGMESIFATSMLVGMDRSQLEACLKSEKYKSLVQEDMKTSDELKLNSQAYAFINGQKSFIQESMDEIEMLIRQAQ